MPVTLQQQTHLEQGQRSRKSDNMQTTDEIGLSDDFIAEIRPKFHCWILTPIKSVVCHQLNNVHVIFIGALLMHWAHMYIMSQKTCHCVFNNNLNTGRLNVLIFGALVTLTITHWTLVSLPIHPFYVTVLFLEIVKPWKSLGEWIPVITFMADKTLCTVLVRMT